MDILLTDSLLREFLGTKANPKKIAECLSLCGPSIEKITKVDGETVYHIEITTNRVDSAGALGIAREATAILPHFGEEAFLKENNPQLNANNKEIGVKILIDKNICERFVAVKLTNVKVLESPEHIKASLTAMGQRPINNVIDITNYSMFALGTPMHAFDLDKLGDTIIVREAEKGEKFVTLDEKHRVSSGGEVVFDNGKGEIIDFAGIMGASSTRVTHLTKNILLVMEHISPLRIREASLKHELRTNAAVINEKDPDPNAIDYALRWAVGLFEKHAKAKVDSKIFDWYPKPRLEQKVKINKQKIDSLLGVVLKNNEITKILQSLDFETKWNDNEIQVTVPTFRVKDVSLQEDVLEEIARIYGYFRLPSILPEGKIPMNTEDKQFSFENRIKILLSGFGGNEVYTLSMTSKVQAGEGAIKIKNPLGGEGECMRTELTPSLLQAVKSNKQETEPFFLFEISNVYKSQKNKLPVEESFLCGAFANTDFRQAKGVLEALFEALHITSITPRLQKHGNIYSYEYSVAELQKAYVAYSVFKPIPMFPPQIEDITVVLNGAKVGEVIKQIKDADPLVNNVEFTNKYEDSHTFRISYQHNEKTLTDLEVTKVREKILSSLNKG